jgi:acyl-CoA thioesterase FadM
LRVRYEGRVGERPVFVARNTMVIVDMKTFRPTAIPAWLRERFEAAMEAKA